MRAAPPMSTLSCPKNGRKPWLQNSPLAVLNPPWSPALERLCQSQVTTAQKVKRKIAALKFGSSGNLFNTTRPPPAGRTDHWLFDSLPCFTNSEQHKPTDAHL
jgi:hypothetical protein